MGASLLSRIAGAVGTPVYVYDAAVIRARHAALARALSGLPHRVHYAVKANGNLAVLALLRGLGAGADIVSGGEMARVLRAGFRPADLVFSGVGKTTAELEAAIAHGVGLVAVESGQEADRIAALAAGRSDPVAVGIRINPDVTVDTHPYTRTAGQGIKFGVPLDRAVEVARRLHEADGVVVRCVGAHIGSQVTDPDPYRKATATLVAMVRAFREAGIDTLDRLDVGGGLGVASSPGGRSLDPAAFADAVRPGVEETGLRLLVEPGRALVAEAGTLLTRVLYRKVSGGRHLAIVDAGMNDFMRPSLYQAEHAIECIEGGAGPDTAVDVVGPLCESGDFLGIERVLPDPAPGALLAIRAAGAYGFSMTSNYNARPRPAEVLVDGNRWAVVRARESVDDLMRGETAEPEWSA